MWIFLPFGFYSIVAIHQNGEPTDRLFVRARDRDDVGVIAEKLRAVSRTHGGTICLHGDRCHGQAPSEHVPSCPAYVPQHIVETPKNDYRFRIMIHRSLWALALSAFVCDELTYPNFKAEVYRTQGVEREQLYARVWSTLRSFWIRPVEKAQRAPRSRT